MCVLLQTDRPPLPHPSPPVGSTSPLPATTTHSFESNLNNNCPSAVLGQTRFGIGMGIDFDRNCFFDIMSDFRPSIKSTCGRLEGEIDRRLWTRGPTVHYEGQG